MAVKALRIGIDARPLQNHHKYRGIGHFLYSSLEALGKIDHKNHYVIFLLHNKPGDLPKFGSDFSYEIKVVPAARLGIRSFIDNIQPAKSMKWTENLDVFFQADISQGLPQRPLSSVAILYDLIPLHFKRHYFPTWKLRPGRHFYQFNKNALVARLLYKQQLKLYKRAAKVLAISEATRRDGLKFLKLGSDRISTIQLAPSRSQIKEIKSAKLISLKKPYILYIGSIDYRKNVPALIKAYEELRQKGVALRLVLCGKDFMLNANGSPAAENIQKLISSSDFSEDIVVPGYVDSHQLKSLYQNAVTFVFPSLYEGFGLPILEAMAEGCPVIALDNSSIPEVAGGAAMLVPSSGNLTEAIARLLGDSKLRATLVAKGYQQVKQFSWQKTAIKILETFEKVGHEKYSG